jgi:putative membrane protein
MNAVSQVFAVLAAAIYIFVFPLESFLLQRHRWVQKFLSTPPENVRAVMMWAIPTGYKNLVIALGVIAGVVAANTGHLVVGYTLVVYCCANMVLTAPTMLLADLQGHYPRKWESVPGTLAATVPALVALLLLPIGP